jgi:hypothetical protein
MIRPFEPGDEEGQVQVYNQAAAALPKFKPATIEEVRRRCRAADFEPGTRFYAIESGAIIGYATFHQNGRVNYPWCLKGHEDKAEPLFQTVLDAMRKRRLPKAFAAYREDWTPQAEFFLAHGFQKARDMVNFVVDLVDMPTAAARRHTAATPFKPADLPYLAKLAPQTLRVSSLPELERHYLHNPYFAPESLFVIRGRDDGLPQAFGVLIANAEYASPKQVDAAMPCFRLGAFGTEGMQSKRINGLFSFLTRESDVNRMGLELLSHAVFRLHHTEVETFAAQVPSDSPHLLRFFQSHFRKQGSFPVFARAL